MNENGDSACDPRALTADSSLRLLIFLCVLLLAALLECRRLSALGDPEIWGHLRVGAWMLQNKAWPVSGLFSQSANLPWRDFSWAFAVLAAIAYRIAGYAALPTMLIIFRIALALGSFLLAGGWRNFWSAAALSVVVQYVLLEMGPGPAFISVLLFAWEAWVLWGARETGNVRRLWSLPVLFVVWANFDTGFVYGFALYLLFLVALLSEACWSSRDPALPGLAATIVPLSRAVSIGLLCLIASCVNPYGFYPYVGFVAAELSPVNHDLPAYNAMGFRQPQDYVLMLLGMLAFLALGLVRSRDFFQVSSLVGAAALAFHAQREGWLLALVGVAVIGQTVRRRKRAEVLLASQWNSSRLAVAGAALILSLGIFFFRKGRNQDLLLAKVAENYPVSAADFLRRHSQPMPLFNDYKWGSFLTWYLPEVPIAIDSRRGLYSEEMEIGYFKAMKADISYREYPPMNQARTLLLNKSSVMGQAFRGVAGFRVIYEDDLTIVYSHENKEQP